VLLVDTRDHRPEPDGDRRDDGLWEAIGAVLRWLFPWPALIFWLFVGAMVLHGIPGLLFALATLGLCAWRGARAYPSWGGLSDHQQ
jgi:hypothetical protein